MLTKNLPLKSLLYVIFIRVIFDIISIMRYFTQGRFNLSTSVIKAHINYFKLANQILSQRDNSLKKENYYKTNSIVYKYFILGKKKFFSL